MLFDSVFTLQFLHIAAEEPVAALRLFWSYLHFFSPRGSTEAFSSLCRFVVPWKLEDWEGMSTHRFAEQIKRGGFLR